MVTPLITTSLVLLLGLLPLVTSYCFGAGYNPYFTGPPVVEQVTLTSVRVSWHGLLELGDCADNIMVKHYRGINSNDYVISDPLDVSVNTYIVHDISPNQPYTYQVIAREEKGLLGVDYNRGEKAVFTTSKKNRDQGLEVKPDDFLQVRVDADDDEGTRQGRGKARQQYQGTETNPTLPDSQRTKPKVAGLEVEVLMGIIVGALVVVVIAVGLIYNCVKKKGPEKDLELNSSMYAEDEDEDEDEDGDEEGDGEEDKFEDNVNDGKKYDRMVEQNRKDMSNGNKLMRPMSVA